jgi:hypothetical protein
LLLLRTGQTFYLIPHNALGAELTDDYKERHAEILAVLQTRRDAVFEPVAVTEREPAAGQT